MDEAESDAYNELSMGIGRSLVKGTFSHGGDTSDALVVLESVVVGTCLTLIKLGGDEAILEVMMQRARERMAEARLKDIQPEGTA